MELNMTQEMKQSLPVVGLEEESKNEKLCPPNHLHVVVLRACCLRAKGTTGTSNPYVVIQLQKQKFRTSVVSHSLSPEWHEECTLQLPATLDDSEEHSLILTVMHRSLHHFSQFLGRVCLPLAPLLRDKTKKENEWFVLQSQPGKKEKTRGKLQLDIQFLHIPPPTTGTAFKLSRPWSLFHRFYGSKKGKKYWVHKEASFQSSSLANEGSSSSSVSTELEASAMTSQPIPGTALHMVTAFSVGKKPDSKTQLEKLIPCNYKGLSSNAVSTTQFEHPTMLEQFSSLFTQPPKKKSKPLKEERSPEAAGISLEAWQASLPPLHVAGLSNVPPRAQTLHFSTVNLQQTPSTSTTSSAPSHVRRCQMRLHRSYQFCRQCFGLSS